MTTFPVETILLLSAIALYSAAMGLLAHAVIFRHSERIRWGLWATLLGLVPHSASLLLRWVSVGHGPYMMRYEVLSSNAWIATLMLLVFTWRRRRMTVAAPLVLSAIILMMGFGIFSNPEAHDLPPSLRSVWLVFHVLFSKLSTGAFLLSAGSSIALLRRLSDRHGRSFPDWLPASDVLDAFVIWFIGFGMIFWTTAIAAGAIWANQSWGRYWGWDPLEIWALVMWLCYGLLLHARRFLKLSPRSTAWGSLLCFGVSVLSIFILPALVSSLHDSYFR